MISRATVVSTIFISILYCIICCDAGAEVYFFKLRLPSGLRADNYSRAQERSSWCWAASAEMALRSQGISDVSQASLVASIRGIPVNTPGYVHEVARALTGIARDRFAGLVVSQSAVYERGGNGQFAFGNSYMNGPGFAFLLAHGIPVIAFYNTGGQTGHFVLVSGVSIDSNDPSRVIHYQIEDPWPLDEQGRRITDSRGVSKQVDAAFIETNGIAFIVPLIIADTNINHMTEFLENYREIARNPSAFTFMDFVQMVQRSTTSELRRFNSLDELGRNVNLPLHGSASINFRSFAKLTHGDKISKARRFFGNPASTTVGAQLTHDYYCDDGFKISYITKTETIRFINISNASCVDWVRSKVGATSLLTLLGKKKGDVKTGLGVNSSDEGDYLKYSDGQSVDLEFTCYDVNDYRCNEISLHWY